MFRVVLCLLLLQASAMPSLAAPAADAAAASAAAASRSAGAAASASSAVVPGAPMPAATPAVAASQGSGDPTPPTDWLRIGMAGVAMLLGVGALAMVAVATMQADVQGGLRMTSYWGGFGGTGTGWHVTAPAVTLLAAALLAALASVFAFSTMTIAKPEPPAEKTGSGGTKAAAEK